MSTKGRNLIGQALMQALGQLGQGLGQSYSRNREQERVQGLLNQLQGQMDPTMRQEQTPGGFVFPQVDFEKRPMLSEQNIGLLSQLPEKTMGLLGALQPKFSAYSPGSLVTEQRPGKQPKPLFQVPTKEEPRKQWPLIKRERVRGAGGDEAELLHYGDKETGEIYYTRPVPFTPRSEAGGRAASAASATGLKQKRARIAQLTTTNQKLGQDMRWLDAGKYKDAGGNLIAAGTPAADLVKEGLMQQIEANDRMLEMLNQEIGGKFTAPDRRTRPASNYQEMDEDTLFEKAQSGDPAAYGEAKRRGLVK